MANFPFSAGSLPSADPPYPIHIIKDGKLLIKTDNCGSEFKVVRDIHQAAIIMINHVVEESKRVISPLIGERRKRYCVAEFIFIDNQLVDVVPARQAHPEYEYLKNEDRPEVLQFIDILKSIIKLKTFW